MSKTTHISLLRSQYKYNRTQILWLTGMTEDQYTAFQYEMGMSWLAHYTQGDRKVLDDLMHRRIIWRWWLNAWNLRDDSYILTKLYSYDAQDRLGQYRSMHQAIFLKNTPPYIVLEDGYALAINRFHDHLSRKQS